MAPGAFFGEMVEAGVSLIQSDTPGRSTRGRILRVGPEGLEARLDVVPAGRFSWLEFELPESRYRVRALGEMTGMLAATGESRVLFRFKHLFPRDRAALGEFLSHRAAA